MTDAEKRLTAWTGSISMGGTAVLTDRASGGRPDRLRQGYGGPPKLCAKAEGLHYI
jgi:hypothetical protein